MPKQDLLHIPLKWVDSPDFNTLFNYVLGRIETADISIKTEEGKFLPNENVVNDRELKINMTIQYAKVKMEMLLKTT